MKILKTKKIDGCLEGSNVRDILFDDIITTEFAGHLGGLGKFILKEEMDKPFFRIIVRGRYTLKGSVGNKTARVILPEESPDGWLEEIEQRAGEF